MVLARMQSCVQCSSKRKLRVAVTKAKLVGLNKDITSAQLRLFSPLGEQYNTAIASVKNGHSSWQLKDCVAHTTLFGDVSEAEELKFQVLGDPYFPFAEFGSAGLQQLATAEWDVGQHLLGSTQRAMPCTRCVTLQLDMTHMSSKASFATLELTVTIDCATRKRRKQRSIAPIAASAPFKSFVEMHAGRWRRSSFGYSRMSSHRHSPPQSFVAAPLHSTRSLEHSARNAPLLTSNRRSWHDFSFTPSDVLSDSGTPTFGKSANPSMRFDAALKHDLHAVI